MKSHTLKLVFLRIVSFLQYVFDYALPIFLLFHVLKNIFIIINGKKENHSGDDRTCDYANAGLAMKPLVHHDTVKLNFIREKDNYKNPVFNV